MKKLISLIALAAFSAIAADTITLYNGTVAKPATPAKVLAVRAHSTVADGTAVVKAESQLLATREDVRTSYSTNVTYTLVYSNGVNQVITNTVTREATIMPLPRNTISYATNEIVNVLSVTNIELYVAKVFTNEIASVTCSGGTAESTPSGKFIYAGDRVFFTGTAKGDVSIITE